MTAPIGEKRQTSGVYKKTLTLAVAGGLAFWAATIAISLTPTAADYRAAESIASIQSVWVGGLIIGLIMAFLISYILVRFYVKIPTKNSILKSLILTFIALIVLLLVIEFPSALRTGNALYYFLDGVLLNVPRFLVFGIVVGYLYSKLYGSATARNV
jgi:uncharacterized protein YacL